MPNNPEQVLTSMILLNDREMLDKNGIISTNHTLATPACHNKSRNGDIMIDAVCLSTGDDDIKATSSTRSSSVQLPANNSLVDLIHSHDYGCNILLCHGNDNDEEEEEEEEDEEADDGRAK